MPNNTDKGRPFSLYLASTYPFLLDILARKYRFKSRSEFISSIVENLCIEDGLLNPATKEPTAKALSRSHALRKFLEALKKAEEGKKTDKVEKKELPHEKVKKALAEHKKVAEEKDGPIPPKSHPKEAIGRRPQ